MSEAQWFQLRNEAQDLKSRVAAQNVVLARLHEHSTALEKAGIDLVVWAESADRLNVIDSELELRRLIQLR